MDSTSNTMIVVSILEARNICKPASSKPSKDNVFVEARFNKECLTSDLVPLVNTNPKLMTKLCWELSRKCFQVFRKERKPIKLQCFVENDFNEKSLIGYTILDLRSAQESQDPKFDWRPLLNTKYKGPSHLRPELLLALQFIPLNDDQENLTTNINDTRSISQSQECLAVDNLENDINVLLQNGVYYFWDSKKHYSQSSFRRLTLSILLSKFAYLYKLIQLPAKVEELSSFYFKINIFRNTFKTEIFSNLDSLDLKAKQIDFHLDIDHISTLKSYFDLHPTLEIQLCNQKSNIFGFVTIFLTHLFSNQSNDDLVNIIEGTFQVLPSNDSIQIKDPSPSIDLVIKLTTSIKNCTCQKSLLHQVTSQNNKANSITKLNLNSSVNLSVNHFCLILDIRSITIETEIILPLNSCLVRYSYPFFGCNEKLQSSSIKASELGEYVFEEGCFEFNFATNLLQLNETFESNPLILDIIEKSSKNILLGISTVNLNDIFNVIPLQDEIKIKIKSIPVLNAHCEKIAELMLIFSFKNLGLTNLEENLIQLHPISNPNKSINGIDDLLMDAAYEIEVWKESQLKNFQSDLKQREIECVHVIEDRLKQKEIEHENNLKIKLKHVYDLEEKLTQSLKNIDLKQSLLEEKRISLERKEKEITSRFQHLDQEITKAIDEIKLSYESEANEKLQFLEEDKKKLKEKIVMLEAKLDQKVEEVEKYEKRFSNLNKVSNSSLLKPKIQEQKKKVRSDSGSEPHPFDLNSKNLIKVKENNARNKINQSAIKTSKMKTTNSASKDDKLEFKNKAAVLLAEIKKERNHLLKNGLSKHHPIIREIDSHFL